MASSQHPLLQPTGGNYGNEMQGIAPLMSQFLKALSHEGRLMILFHLADGEKTVKELEHLLSAQQANVSQQLARLRLEGLVFGRREGKFIHYRLADERLLPVLEGIDAFFCEEKT